MTSRQRDMLLGAIIIATWVAAAIVVVCVLLNPEMIFGYR